MVKQVACILWEVYLILRYFFKVGMPSWIDCVPTQWLAQTTGQSEASNVIEISITAIGAIAYFIHCQVRMWTGPEYKQWRQNFG